MTRSLLDRTPALGLVLAMLVPTVLARQTFAAGDEYQLPRVDDLVVTVNTKWAGCSSGGYYPIRILVQNKGVDCNLTFVFNSKMEGIAGAQRTIAVAQNATVKFTLPVPCVGTGTYGDLRVLRNGRPVKGMNRSVSLPDAHTGGTSRPSFLVISPDIVDFDPLETAVTSTLPEAVAGGSGGYGHYGYYGIAAENHEQVEPAMLPEEWIAYSGLDFVAVPLATLAKLSSSERTALLKWVHTGGSLIVYGVGEPAAESRVLNDLLSLDEHAAISAEWQPARVEDRKLIHIIQTDDYGSILTPAEAENGMVPVVEGEFKWPADSGIFASRDLMLGHVHAFRENPFADGTAQDWNWFLTRVPAHSRNWTVRHGITSRYGTDQFLEFLIPSVRGVPVMAFLLLITLFTVIIGPLNYMFLWRRRRLYLLVLTIPVIALGTSLSLFAYSAVAHGFATKSRARTLLYVDQDAKSAVTLSRIALYAGLAPSDGMRFSSETAVMPIWPEDQQIDTAVVDWTDQQNLRKGWLKSRTRTQFLTIGHRDERGRLDVAASGEGLTVINGFEWGLESLIVSDATGQLFSGSNIAAGESALLSPIDDQQRKEIAKLFRQHPLQPPDLSDASNSWLNFNIGTFYGYQPDHTIHFGNSRLEQLMSRMTNLQFGGATYQPNSYAALLTENPGIELGVERTRPQASLHVLMGHY